MSIQYSLRKNHLIKEQGGYVASVQSRGTITMEQLIERMLQRGSAMTRGDLIATMELYEQTIIDALIDGMTINTPLVKYRSSVKGVFADNNDGYDSTRHTITPIAIPGSRLWQMYRTQARLEKVRLPKQTPVVDSYQDIATGSQNELLTPGNGGRITGHQFGFDPEDPEQGIFFISEDSTAVSVTAITFQRPSEIVFATPSNLTAGTYTLQVRVRFGKTEIRTGELEAPLIVT